MRLPTSAIAAGLCLIPAAASAVDWSLQSTSSETVELNDNQFLLSTPNGGTVSSYTTASEKAEARTATSKFDLTADTSYRRYWGPGAEGLPANYNLTYSFNGHYELTGKTTPDRTWIEADYRSQSSAFALLNELGVINNTIGAINRLTFSGGADRSVSAWDTLSAVGSSTDTTYDPASAGTPFRDTNANLVWRHRFSPLSSFTVSSGAEWLTYANAFNTNVVIVRNQAGVDTTFSPLLSFHASAGAANVLTMNGVGAATLPAGDIIVPVASPPGTVVVHQPSGTYAIILAPGTPIPLNTASLGFIGDALVTYKPTRTMTAILSASQSIGPSLVGSLFETSTARASVAQAINAASTLTLAADFTRSVSTTTTDFASASASYSYQWARAWTATATYRFLHRFQAIGTTTIDPITNTPVSSGLAPATSNSLVVTVTRSFTDIGHTD